MLFRRKYGWVGLVIMPVAIFNLLLPIFFIPILMVINIENILAGNLRTVIIFFFATITLQFITALISVLLARERLSLLLAVPFTRLVYSPIRTVLLYRTVFSALRGVSVGWNKLQRSGAVQLSMVSSPRQPIPQTVTVGVETEEMTAS
jgi:biofilm PGA synthesis N-glycosyltransferase PgaC